LLVERGACFDAQGLAPRFAAHGRGRALRPKAEVEQPIWGYDPSAKDQSLNAAARGASWLEAPAADDPFECGELSDVPADDTAPPQMRLEDRAIGNSLPAGQNLETEGASVFLYVRKH
jgi:hypothetical protein